jgi:hypothetical protein
MMMMQQALWSMMMMQQVLLLLSWQHHCQLPNRKSTSLVKKNPTSPVPFECAHLPQLYMARYSIKVHLEKVPEKQGASKDVLLVALGEIVNKLQELDSQLLFYPYLQVDQLPITNHLLCLDQLKWTDKELKKFFFNVSPWQNSGNIYVEVLMWSSKPWNELEDELEFWLKENQQHEQQISTIHVKIPLDANTATNGQ